MLVDGLVANGVRRAFCVPGESYLAALDAFHHHRERIRLIACRQEGGAAYMAEASGKLSRSPGVCFVSRGPGAANAMIGVHTAFQDSTPILLFIGQVARGERGLEAFQELDYGRVYGGVAKLVLRVEHAEEIPEKLREAWGAAISDRPGPVVVELPEDVLAEEGVAADCEMPTRAPKTPTAQQMAQFTQLLAAAERPLVICGGAGWTPPTNELLAAFADTHRIPVACAFRRQDMFDNTHPCYVGELGVAPDPTLEELVREADVVIALAARLGDITTCGYTLFDVPEFDRAGKRKLVHVFPAAAELNSVFHAALGIDCDAEGFLQAARAMAPSGGGRAEWAERTAEAKRAYLARLDGAADGGAGAVRMEAIMAYLRERLPDDSIIANGAGNYTLWAQRNYQFRQPATQLASTNGSMGYGVAAGIAGKLARPRSIVVSFSGDGCFLMNGQELATAVQYGVHVIFLVLNNSCYGTIRAHQERHYPGRPIATSLDNPDFAALARAYGAFGATVRRTDEFEPAFERALAADSPALIEIQMDQ